MTLHPSLTICLDVLRSNGRTTPLRKLNRIASITERLIERTGDSADVPGACDIHNAAVLYRDATRLDAHAEWVRNTVLHANGLVLSLD